MVGDFYSIIYEVVYIIRVTTATFGILYYTSLYEVVYIIPISAYTSIRLYEYLLIRVSASPLNCLLNMGNAIVYLDEASMTNKNGL